MKNSMNVKLTALSLVLAVVCFLPKTLLAVGPDFVHDFPAPQNVRLESSALKWDPVNGAGGYNIYYRADRETDVLRYYTTVRDTTEFDLSTSGNYAVVAYNLDVTLFSSEHVESVWVDFLQGEDQDVQTLSPSDSPIHLFSVTCRDVESGGSCIASCSRPAQSTRFFTTGGACSTSDMVEADATAGVTTYECTVPTYSAEVRAQVYCLDYFRFDR